MEDKSQTAPTKMSRLAQMALLKKQKEEKVNQISPPSITNNSADAIINISQDKFTNLQVELNLYKSEVDYLRKRVDEYEKKNSKVDEKSILGADGLIKADKAAALLEKTKEVVNLVRRPLEFTEDSPDFELSLLESEKGLKDWLIYSKSVIDALQNYCEKSSKMKESSLKLASLLGRSFTKDNILISVGQLSPGIALFSNLLNDVEKSREIFTNKLINETLIAIKEIVDQVEQEMSAKKASFESCKKKLSFKGATARANFQSYEVERFKYIQALNGVESYKLKIIQKLAVAAKHFVRCLREEGEYGYDMSEFASVVEEGVYQALHGYAIDGKKQDEILENIQKSQDNNVSSFYLQGKATGEGKLGMMDVTFYGFLEITTQRKENNISARVWSQIAGSQFLFSSHDVSLSDTLSLSATSIKYKDGENSFEIKDSTSSTSYLLRAETSKQAETWVFQLRARIGEFQTISRLFPKCSDCSSPFPSYLSPSLSIALCETCYNIIISFVDDILSNATYLKLSSPNWSGGQIRLMMKSSGDQGKSIWQYKVPPQWIKPNYQDPIDDFVFQEAKEQWLRAKYVDRFFIQQLDGVPQDKQELTANRYIHEAALQGDVLGILRGILWSGNVRWMNEASDYNCALHVAASEGNIEAVEALLSHGDISISQFNSDYHTAYNLAFSISSFNKPNSKKCKNVASLLSMKAERMSLCPLYFFVIIAESMHIFKLSDDETVETFVQNIQKLNPSKQISYVSKHMSLSMFNTREDKETSSLLAVDSNVIIILPCVPANALPGHGGISIESAIFKKNKSSSVFHCYVLVNEEGKTRQDDSSIYNVEGDINDNGDCWANDQKSSVKRLELTLSLGFQLNDIRKEVISFTVNDISIAAAAQEWLSTQYYSLQSTLSLFSSRSERGIVDSSAKVRGAILISRHIEAALSPPFASVFTTKLATSIINDYKEWCLDYKSTLRTKLKQEFIRQQRMCKEMGIIAPDLPDINGLVDKPVPTILNQLESTIQLVKSSFLQALKLHLSFVNDTARGIDNNFKLESTVLNSF